MRTKPFVITCDDAEKELKALIEGADSDLLGALVELAFGCKVDDGKEVGEEFIITPTKDYSGGLDNIVKFV